MFTRPAYTCHDGAAPGAPDDGPAVRLPGCAGHAGFGAGVLEDWRTVLELVAARNARLGAVD
ncbi:hypothetical protein [Streptomyces antibioticus]|uniref:hypothetical protein n=1 Tax=Streptomyces antibioticus TaxID=1890 RepID=UPI00368C1FAB